MKKAIVSIIVLIVVVGAITVYATQDAKSDNSAQQANVGAVTVKDMAADTNQVNNSSNTNMENANVAQNGDMVFVHYTGKLTDGTKFDSSVDRGQPFGFMLGSGMVIAGWDKGVLGMKIGEKKTLTIAPEDGYGATGVKNPQTGEVVIPANATLVFDVELIDIKR